MILLESHNQAVKDFIWGFMDNTRHSLKTHDFNDIIYCCEESEDGPLAISIALQSLMLPNDFPWRKAVEAKLAQHQGLTLRAEPIAPYTLTVLLDVNVYTPRKLFTNNHKSKGLSKDEIKEQYEKYKAATFEQHDKAFSMLSSLRRVVLGTAFEHHFDKAVSEEEGDQETDWMTLKAYKGEAVYVRAVHQAVRVIYQIQFTNQEEEIFGRIFAQEFNEARRKLTGIPVPPVTYTTADPTELTSIVKAAEDREVHFFKFSLERHHLLSDHREKAIDQLLMFRNYLDYHIKCSKAYMHSRMRFKTAYFLKILNRAEKQADAMSAKKPRPSVSAMQAQKDLY